MASRRGIRHRSCQRKKKFSTVREALDMTFYLLRKGVISQIEQMSLRPYKCRFCGCWHNGHFRRF